VDCDLHCCGEFDLRQLLCDDDGERGGDDVYSSECSADACNGDGDGDFSDGLD
jgi:hypothetical protein